MLSSSITEDSEVEVCLLSDACCAGCAESLISVAIVSPTCRLHLLRMVWSDRPSMACSNLASTTPSSRGLRYLELLFLALYTQNF